MVAAPRAAVPVAAVACTGLRAAPDRAKAKVKAKGRRFLCRT